MGAVLAGGRDAVLSHESAAVAWRIRRSRDGPIEISVSPTCSVRVPGLRIHRRCALADHCLTRLRDIPLTSPARTLLDLAARVTRAELERAVNEADKLDLVDPDRLRRYLRDKGGQRGVRRLRMLLDRDTFVLTDSELERRFWGIVRAARLPMPLTRAVVNGFMVDFFWPDPGLIVETDGLRYHRTPTQQSRDRLRDQIHARAGLTTLRFTHAQVSREPDYVRCTLIAVARRLTSSS
jgi:very-short-patch-repair endonuclease